MKDLKETFVIPVILLIFICLQSTAIAQNRQADADKVFAEAEALRDQKTAQTLRQAIQKYEETLAIWRELGNKSKEAAALQNIGVIYRELGEATRSIEFLNQSLTVSRSFGDRENEAYSLLYLGQSYDNLGDSRRQADVYNRALLIAREIKSQKLEIDALASLGFVFYRLGELQNALNYYNQALPVYRATGDKDGEAILLVNIGAIYSALGNPQGAIDNFLQALPIFRALENPQREAVILNNIGTGFEDLGDFPKALDYYTQSLALRRKTGDRLGEAVALGGIARVHFSLKDNQKALEFYGQALIIQRELKARRSEGNTLSNLGRIYLAAGDYQKAFELYSESLPIRRETGDILGESTTLFNLAYAQRERANLTEAHQLIDNAIQIVESVRAALASQDLRESFFALSQDIYAFKIDLLMRLDAKQPGKGFDALAFEASENARARSFLDILAESRAEIRQGVDVSLLERERDLQKQLNAKDVERRRAGNAPQAATLDIEIQKLTSAYRELQAEIRLKSPRYASLTQPKPSDLKEIQRNLDADTILLEYSLGKEKSFLWLVSQNSIKSFVLAGGREIEDKAREFYESVKKPDAAEKAQKSAADLSKILLQPAASEFGGKRLLIVADNILQYIPFAALPVAGFSAKSEPTKRLEYNPLIVSNEIIYLPSASTLTALRADANGRKAAPKTIAVIADPVFDADDTRIRNGIVNQSVKTETADKILEKATRNAGFQLPRLPGTRREATAILSLVAATERKQAIDFQANRTTATSPELANYRIIHFATHALLNSQNPELSGIVLSLFDQNGKAQDGFLRLHEIYNLKLPAELVVLSACQTALGKDIKGEGLVGLTRGFMYAGAQRVVASLWMVDDRATSDLMKIFYQGMLGEKKLRPSAALREAQIALLKNKRFAAPYFWSAFTMQGDWR